MKPTERQRLKRFRQVRSDIRGSSSYLVVGIDIGKETHHAFFGHSGGKSLYRRLVIGNHREGFDRLLVQIDALKTRHNLSDVVIGVEPTAGYHKPLAHFLTGRGFLVVLLAGTAVRNNRELLDGRWDKNDTKDAANIADLVSQGKFQYLDLPSIEIQSLRELHSLLKRLKKERRSLKTRARNCLLARYFPEFDRLYGRAELENLAIIEWCLNPKQTALLSYHEFSAKVTRRRTGLAQEKRLRNILNAAKTSVGCPFTPSAAFEAKMLVEKIRYAQDCISRTEKEIRNICSQMPEYHHLMSIPGFGPFVSSLVLARIGSPFRFQNRSQVIKMAGLDLNASRSGKTAAGRVPKISKRGSGQLRYALYQAAFVASGHHTVFTPYFTRLLKGREAEKGIVLKMRIKLAAKLLVIAWTLLKRDQDFNPELISRSLSGEAAN